jgi:4-hydroxybenzoate polyprenyltransferase
MPSISKPGSGIDGQTFRGGSLLVRFANFVKLPHTVFALPFALLGVVYASFSTTVAPTQLFLVAVAFTAARFAAMGFNRIVDLRIDALNPRTVNRELVQGKLTLGQAWGAVMVTSLVFLISASLLNTLCMVLAPLALAWILSYSYTKHFTNLSQLWLGVSLAIAPVGGYLDVTGVGRGGVYMGRRIRHLLRAAGRDVRPRTRSSQPGCPVWQGNGHSYG